MKYFYQVIFYFIVVNNAFAQDLSIDFFPEGKIYQRYYADALSHQFSISKHLESSEWFGNIGASIPAADLSIYGHTLQVSAAATVFNTLIKTPGHIQVYTVDYLVDFFFDKEIFDNFFGRALFGHLSAHYSDDGILQMNNYPLNYVRDYIGLQSQYLIEALNGKVYAGFNYNFHNEPKNYQHYIQSGLDGGYYVLNNLFLYGAIDIKFKSEVNDGSTQSYQFGLIFPALKKSSFRLAYTHRRGYEERGQLFYKNAAKNSLGIYLDF